MKKLSKSIFRVILTNIDIFIRIFKLYTQQWWYKNGDCTIIV